MEAGQFGWYTLAALCVLATVLQSASCLKCLVGLGNTSERPTMKVVACPEDKFYVCVKMFGGGMGDQIKRKCEKVSVARFEELLEQEDAKEQARLTGPDLDGDPACYADKHNGRDVRVCLCSTDRCNAAATITGVLGNAQRLIAMAGMAMLAPAVTRHLMT